MNAVSETLSNAAPTAVCNLLTDSCCDLTHAYLEENGVGVLHFTYAEAGKEDGLSGVDDLFESRSAHDFYEAIRGGAEPMTSQPSPGEFERVFRAALATGRPTVYITLSSGISGCYEGACAVRDRLAEEFGPDIPLYIVDSRIGSTAQTLLVVEAIRRRDMGYTAEELARWAEEARYCVNLIFMVDDLHALRRGGRIPAGVATVGSLLGVKPLLGFDLDGKLCMAGVARGRKKAMRKFVEVFESTHDCGDNEDVVTLGNADCPEDMRAVEEMLRGVCPTLRFVETNIGPTIGCHVGPGMMSCVFWGPDRREGR